MFVKGECPKENVSKRFTFLEEMECQCNISLSILLQQTHDLLA